MRSENPTAPSRSMSSGHDGARAPVRQHREQVVETDVPVSRRRRRSSHPILIRLTSSVTLSPSTIGHRERLGVVAGGLEDEVVLSPGQERVVGAERAAALDPLSVLEGDLLRRDLGHERGSGVCVGDVPAERDRALDHPERARPDEPRLEESRTRTPADGSGRSRRGTRTRPSIPTAIESARPRRWADRISPSVADRLGHRECLALEVRGQRVAHALVARTAPPGRSCGSRSPSRTVARRSTPSWCASPPPRPPPAPCTSCESGSSSPAHSPEPAQRIVAVQVDADALLRRSRRFFRQRLSPVKTWW